MKQLKIVLVEPQIPQNTGNIARTCAVTGASLHLVQPMGFTVTDKHLKRAGLDYWHKLDITYYDDWADFVAKHADEQDQFYFFTTKGKHVHSDAIYTELDSVYLIFGREDKGLPEPLLHAHANQCVRIPMRHTLRSLNLSTLLPLQPMKFCGNGAIQNCSVPVNWMSVRKIKNNCLDEKRACTRRLFFALLICFCWSNQNAGKVVNLMLNDLCFKISENLLLLFEMPV